MNSLSVLLKKISGVRYPKPKIYSIKAYVIFAQSIDCLGYAMGSLTPKVSILSKVPSMDPVPVLTYIDMDIQMTIIL